MEIDLVKRMRARLFIAGDGGVRCPFCKRVMCNSRRALCKAGAMHMILRGVDSA
jgi:hypothetical protein